MLTFITHGIFMMGVLSQHFNWSLFAVYIYLVPGANATLQALSSPYPL